MASGRPVVSTELGTGTSWVNQHEQTGLVVPPGDPKALANALMRLLGDRELAKRYGEAGRERMAKEFTQDLMVDRVDRAYRLATDIVARTESASE
jgi:rhamnosyl/mannosyltransferase